MKELKQEKDISCLSTHNEPHQNVVHRLNRVLYNGNKFFYHFEEAIGEFHTLVLDPDARLIPCCCFF